MIFHVINETKGKQTSIDVAGHRLGMILFRIFPKNLFGTFDQLLLVIINI